MPPPSAAPPGSRSTRLPVLGTAVRRRDDESGSNAVGDQDRARLARELANAIEGDVRFSLHDRLLYATDASLYQVEPLGVVIPASADDAVRAVRFCAERNLPILPRGGGTSLAGQCTNRAVVLDLSPNCRRVLHVDAAARRVRVEPGITVDELNETLAPTGLFFPPDPATSRHANIGGCIGNNAAGARSIRYGRTSESVVSIDACLADGERVHFGPSAAEHNARVRALTERVADVVRRHERLIRERFPKTVRRNAGYGLDMILAQLDAAGVRDFSKPLPAHAIDRLNLAPLLCGSEGTLAITLGAELALVPKPAARGLACVGFASLDEAIAAVVPILSTGPVAVELLDDTVVDLARANAEYARYVELMPAPPAGHGVLKAVLYVEYFADGPASPADAAAHVGAKFDELERVVARACPGATARRYTDAPSMNEAWKLRKAGEPLLHGIPGHRKPITFVEDNAVPVEHLARFVKDFRTIVERHGTRAAFYAHASVGVLHVRPLVDIHDPADRDVMRSIAVEVADLARSLGGVMSGEHGDGRVRSPLLERFYGPELMNAMREVKRIFDPRNLLNPGNIVEPRPVEAITETLRIKPGRAQLEVPRTDTYFSYDDQHGFDAAVEMCNGAGVCRKKQGGTMCPSYMATLDERHSTRGRGNALRLAITGQLEAFRNPANGGAQSGPDWSDPGAIETLDLCLSCKACKTECPSNVDISRLKAEYAAQRYRHSTAPLSARLMGEIRTLNRLGALAPALANSGATLAPARWLARKALGIDARRSLPRFARSLARGFARSAVPEPAPGAPAVLLFGDCFTMFNEPGIGRSTRDVLRRLGYRVILADAGCCARAKISLGLLPAAITEIDATAARLDELARTTRAVAVLVAEPSCLSAIKDDWRTLKCRTPAEVRTRLAAMSFLPEEFIDKRWDAHPARATLEPTLLAHASKPKVILHAHCHQKALWGAQTSSAALARVCGPANVTTLDSGCCGMAGSFGYDARRFDLSMRIGELTLLPAVRAATAAADAHAGAHTGAHTSTLIAATGTSCRHQVHDGAKAHALHPIEIIDKVMRDAGL